MTDKNSVHNLEAFIGNALKDQIINLDLLPGTKLSEMKIAKLYGCSRAPVRDAFSELRVKGYLESRPQVGTFVSKINLDRVEEIRFVRESVETAVLNLGIKNKIGAATEIKAHLHQRLTHGQKAIAIAMDARLVTHGLLQRLT